MALVVPRFSSTSFKLMDTPARLQEALEKEYQAMEFRPVQQLAKEDKGYGASVVHGISSASHSQPQLSYAPISSGLYECAFDAIGPFIEEWFGSPVERSLGHGIRSYGRSSVLHVHRDRVDTHVLSCIVHVDDRSDRPWALDFVDHSGKAHSIEFGPGTMLLYESLCPHGRVAPFEGEFYRNMYFHWRPRDWDPQPYRSLRCKFASLADAQVEVQRLALIDSIPVDWQQWLLLNRDRGCSRDGMIARGEKHGFLPSAMEAILDLSAEESRLLRESFPEAEVSGPIVTVQAALAPAAVQPASVPTWLQWFEAPLTRSNHQPRSWRLDTPLAQVYELPAFLAPQECRELMDAIDQKLVPSTVTRGDSNYRTSRTCHLRGADADLAARLDQRLAELFGIDPRFSEPLQGQRYDPGQYFKEHTDWFAPGTEEFIKHTNPGGQRTWTVMIYLNTVSSGGQTCFKRLGRCFTPIQGLALAWNNLMADGTPNPFTLHEAMPVEDGSKWVITKWFREQPGRNS